MRYPMEPSFKKSKKRKKVIKFSKACTPYFCSKIIILLCMVHVTIVLPEHADGSFGLVKPSRT